MANKEISIVKDYWDWKSERVQVTTGLFVTSVSIIFLWLFSDSNIANTISHEYGKALVTIYDATQNTALHNELNNLSFTYLTAPRLLVHLTTSCFVGLIALEISKIYGNRWGVIHSVWTTLLYMVCPTIVILLYAGDGLFILLGALFATLSLYCEFRFRYLDEDFYLVSSVVFLALSLSLDLVAGLTGLFGIILSRLLLNKVTIKNFSKKLTYSYIALLIPSLLIVMQKGGLRAGHFSVDQTLVLLNSLTNSPEHLIAHTKSLAVVLTSSVCVLLIVTIIRVLVGTLWLRPLIFLIGWLAICFIISSFYIGGNHYLKDSAVIVASLVFYCSMPIAILLSIIALPAIDAVNKPVSISLACLGASILSILFVFWGTEMYSALAKQVVLQKDLKEFRTISNKIALSYSNKRVYLIGLPDSINNFVTAHKMKLTPIRQEKVFTYSKSLRKSDLTFVNKLTSSSSTQNISSNAVFLKWNDKKKTFVPLHHKGRYNFSFIAGSMKNSDLEIIPTDTPMLTKTSFTNTNFGHPFVERVESAITVVGGNTAVTLWLPAVKLNPSLCNRIVIDANLTKSGYSEKTNMSKLKFLWIPANESTSYESDLLRFGSEQLSNNIFNNPNWLGKSNISKIGIKFLPGKYTCQIKKIRIGIGNKQRDVYEL